MIGKEETYKTFAPPPRIVPRRSARKGSSEVTGPHPLSSVNWIGIAAKQLNSIRMKARCAFGWPLKCCGVSGCWVLTDTKYRIRTTHTKQQQNK
jgi:hypothetical protein